MSLPNKITLVRIALVPIFMLFALANFHGYEGIFAAVIFAAAAFTDGLDGHIARSRNQITTLGKFLDPLADKLLVSAALIILVELGKISSWIAVIIICREFAVTGMRTIAVKEGVVIAASIWGKLKTVTQIFAILCLLIYDAPGILGTGFGSLTAVLGTILIWAALIVTILSGVDYFMKCKDMILKEM